MKLYNTVKDTHKNTSTFYTIFKTIDILFSLTVYKISQIFNKKLKLDKYHRNTDSKNKIKNESSVDFIINVDREISFNSRNRTFLHSYYFNQKVYSMILSRRTMPEIVLKILGDNSLDITDKIIEYAGPNRDFHGYKLTPKILGYKVVTVSFIDETVKEYKDCEVISLN